MNIRTSRRKKLLSHEVDKLRDASLIIIAVEGEKTEKQYFESDIFNSPKVHIEILEPEDGKSAPKYVFEKIATYKEEYEIQNKDQLWLVCDVDKWPEKQLSKICSEAIQKGVFLGITNPCFDLWLYLHTDGWCHGIKKSNQIKILLRKKLGSYNSSNLNIEDFRDVKGAIKRAKKMNINPKRRWPQNPGTHVYKLAKNILKLTGKT